MNIWHVIPYDTIPGEAWRPGRAITMCRLLAEHGHQVTWWTSNFSHFFGQSRSEGWDLIDVNPNLKIRLVPVPGYQKHVGLARLRFHLVYAWRLYRQALRESPPDCIILAVPTPGADYVSARLAKHFGARLIIDVRDIWPELFVLAIPPVLRMLSPILFYPFYALRRYAFQNADAVTAVTETYLNVALKDAPHLRNWRSRVIYFGADVVDLREMMEQSSTDNQIQKRPGEIWAIYAGTLGDNYDIKTVLDAAILLKKLASNVKIIVAGSGPLRQYVIDFIQQNSLDNVSYLGSLPLSELAKYYRFSDIGLSPYREGSTVVMPAKVYDYFAAGLPIINSLHGELEKLIQDRCCGIQYTSNNADSLASALQELALDQGKRKLMAENSCDLALKFDRQSQYIQFVELAERLDGG